LGVKCPLHFVLFLVIVYQFGNSVQGGTTKKADALYVNDVLAYGFFYSHKILGRPCPERQLEIHVTIGQKCVQTFSQKT
jgi:hypothetical protein